MATKTKSKTAQPPVRKSFLVGGGVVIGIAILAFVVNTFVLGSGGGGGDIPAPSTIPGSTDTGTDTGSTGVVPGSDGNPIPNPGVDTSRFPKNELTPGGRNPFQAKGGSGGTVAAAAAASAPAPDVETVKSYTWQMLDLKDGKATILVNGTRKIVKVGDKLIGDYTLNSITGQCVTVKGTSTFGLCPGAAPFVQ